MQRIWCNKNCTQAPVEEEHFFFFFCLAVSFSPCTCLLLQGRLLVVPPPPPHLVVPPNQQRTLNKLPTELRCRIFFTKHRLSMQIGAKRAKTCRQQVLYTTFQLSFHFAYHRWWLGNLVAHILFGPHQTYERLFWSLFFTIFFFYQHPDTHISLSF